MDRSEREAARFLASYLTMVNTAEFLDRIDKILEEYERDLLSVTEALWQIRKLRESMTSSNARLRELSRGDNRPPSGASGPLLPWTPP
jgi:hypothetical protein